MNDSLWMKAAVDEGMKGRINAPPNPWVGCVLVKGEEIVGKGYHPECGKPHAEIYALKAAGNKSRGSTAYVTLEPCSHHGRTPPCVNALIEAGVARVVIGTKDPDPKVSGSGIKALRNAGIEVVVGVENEMVESSLASYLHQRSSGRPFVIAKTALSIDGRAAASDGSSQWISCEAARRDAHQLRAESQAILIGAGTAIKDNPRLNVRDAEILPNKQPLRVILDRSGKLSEDSPVYLLDSNPPLVFSEYARVPEGVELINETSPEKIISILGNRGILQLLIEGGPATMTNFLEKGLIDRLIVYTGPCLIGKEGLPGILVSGISSIKESIRLKLQEAVVIGETVKSTYKL